MPTSTRRNSAVICNDISNGRADDWRRSFRQQKRRSMLELKPILDAEVPALLPTKPFLGDLEHDEDFAYTNMRVQINDDYEFIDSNRNLLGHGAYGDVFRGKALKKTSSESRAVAIKRMAQMNVKENELKVMKRVQNPFLVQLIDICHDEEMQHTFIVMELCHADLDHFLRTQTTCGCLEAADFNRVLKDIARGYFALYLEGIVHRDIKPQNVLLLLSPDRKRIETAKLTDFGVCRLMTDEEGGLCNVAGTFWFMSPEVGANVLTTTEYNNLVDMWSIGCLLYQCYTGVLPFDEAAMCRLFLYCAGHNYDAYEFPPLPEGTPNEKREIIHRLLEINRERRMTPVELNQAALSAF
ncbi:Protein kinase domain-containing protein [Aphelenchoides fujianensis]|nr:Protein kinase domain-containing protein [Aphelenchoides fujianensis]